MLDVLLWNLCSVEGPCPRAEDQIRVTLLAQSWNFLSLFFRRDYESRPVKLRLLEEIRAHPHKKDPEWVPKPTAPIDYCYVRPNHIPSVNAMCHDSFWPGNRDMMS